MNKLVRLFCDVGDFCKAFILQWKKQCPSSSALRAASKKRDKLCFSAHTELPFNTDIPVRQ